MKRKSKHVYTDMCEIKSEKLIFFLSQVEYERNSGVKFCFHFFGLSHPVLAKNNRSEERRVGKEC